MNPNKNIKPNIDDLLFWLGADDAKETVVVEVVPLDGEPYTVRYRQPIQSDELDSDD